MVDLEKFDKNTESIQESFRGSWGSNIRLGYSIKTNHLSLLLSHSKRHGFYAEAVSNEEYEYAASHGYDLKNIIFNGPQKEYGILKKAIQGGSLVNLDNFQDVEMVEQIGLELGYENISVGLRFNFDLESECMGETGLAGGTSRFGICVENGDLEKAILKLRDKGCTVSGLHVHYTTSTRSVEVYRAISKKAAEVIERYGLKSELKYVDLGGGFWGGRELSGKPSMEEYSAVIAETLRECISPEAVQLILEPGSSLLSTVVFYLTKVMNTRDINGQRFVTVDGSLLDVNPLMCERELDFSIYSSESRNVLSKQIICGGTCLESDRMIHLKEHGELCAGDLVKIHNTGAYTISFNDCFINSPPYVYLKERDKYILIREK